MKFKTPHVIKIPEVESGLKSWTVLQKRLSSNTHFICDKGQERTPRGWLGQEPNWGMLHTSGWSLYRICQEHFRMALDQGCFLSSVLPLSKWECPLGHLVIVSLWLFECECMGKCVFFSPYISRSRRAISILDIDTTKHCLDVYWLDMTGPGQWSGKRRDDFGVN